ncbi:hypothetical protein F5Y10DRAFT_270690 [Nemania abortiva]|nr:hypothetical protein F5Y10DRAFT_270690 [Nemania abortiva]
MGQGVSLVFRLYIRIYITPSTRWGNDDYYYFASFVLFFVYGILIQASAEFGLGRDTSDINSEDDITRGILCELIGQTFLIAANITSKLSVGYFLLLLDQDRKYRKYIYPPVIAFAISVAVTTLISWFSCRPIAYSWDRRLNGHCDISPIPTALIAGTLSVIVDLWYAGLPWYMLVWDKKKFKQRNLIAERQRIGISVCLSLGILAAGFGIKRATELNRLGSANYLRDTAELVIWHVAELGVTLIATGIPICFIPLYKDELNWIVDKCSSFSRRNLWRKGKKLDDRMGKFGLPISRTPYAVNMIPSHANSSTDFRLNENGTTMQAHSPGIYGNESGDQMGTEFQQGQGISRNNSRQGTRMSVDGITEYGIVVRKEVEIRTETPKLNGKVVAKGARNLKQTARYNSG